MPSGERRLLWRRSKAYRILDPKTQSVRTARDVVFNEGRGWVWDNGDEFTTTEFASYCADQGI
jgi:hypothetical protein